MSNMDKIILGSNIAKKGFENEEHIINKFLNWQEDLEAQNWLVMMNYIIEEIKKVMNIFAQGEVKITKQGSLKIGQITMQRKGGDGGRETAKMLQFKVNPLLIF